MKSSGKREVQTRISARRAKLSRTVLHGQWKNAASLEIMLGLVMFFFFEECIDISWYIALPCGLPTRIFESEDTLYS